MKTVFISIAILLLLTACQQTPQSNTIPQTTTAVKPRTQYRLVFLKQERKHEYDNELYFRDFEAKVNQLIAEGWQPLGGVSMAGMGGIPIQTMVKIE